MNGIFSYRVPARELDIPVPEVLRYLGYSRADASADDAARVRDVLERVMPVLQPAACWGRFEVGFGEDGEIRMPYGTVRSFDLSRNLTGCREIFLFAATIGIGFDRLLQGTRLRSMADAAVMQAAGSAAVESFVERLCCRLAEEATKDGLRCRPRYSPGFGDLGLENQKGFFRVLDPARHIGLSLKENCIMVPEKSVTAVVGIDG